MLFRLFGKFLILGFVLMFSLTSCKSNRSCPAEMKSMTEKERKKLIKKSSKQTGLFSAKVNQRSGFKMEKRKKSKKPRLK